MPVRSLAERVEVSNPTIYGYEKGAASPRPEVLKRLCEALAVPEQYFLLPVEEARAGAIYYRANRSTSVAACDAAEARLAWFHRLGAVVAAHISLPQVNLPTPVVPSDPLELSDDDIEKLALETRRYWGLGLGPLSNVVALLEKHGVLVARTEVDAESLDGVSRRFDDRPVVLLAANKRSGPRSRFDAAHELAHLILHRDVDQGRLNKPGEWRKFEDQAHAFAGAFLFPPEAFRSELASGHLSIERCLAIKMRWKVSVGAMIMQAKRLGVIGLQAAKRLHINYARRGMTRGEPYDEQIPPEQPRLLRRALEVWVAEASAEEVCASLPFGIRDVVSLTGVPRGVLTGETARIIEMVPPPAERSVDHTRPAFPPAEVVPLRPLPQR